MRTLKRVPPAHPDAGYYHAQFARIGPVGEYKPTMQIRGSIGQTNCMDVTQAQLDAIERVMCDPVLAGVESEVTK